jgi:hypothetical protein
MARHLLPPWQFNGGKDIPADVREYGETVRDRINVLLSDCHKTVQANRSLLDQMLSAKQRKLQLSIAQRLKISS